VHSEFPRVSVIIPCRNESRHIGSCLASIAECDFPKDRLEVLVVDGMSDDDTRTIAQEFAEQHSYARVLENPRRITPAALNLGVAAAGGDVIVRMDAHCDYPADYLSALVRSLEETGADNVGGICLTRPARDTAIAGAIAIGLSHPLGVGNSYFRIGSATRRCVDTVPFGCYRRDVFERIGLFDEELVRNQDDEFNLRLRKHGGRILLIPEIAARYYPRDSLRKLWQMYYQYGYFKPLVVKKVGGVMTFRQLVPATLVVSLVMSWLAVLVAPGAWWLAATILAAYVSALLAAAVPIGWRRGLRCGLAMLLVFPTLHFSYGFGFLRGVAKFLFFSRRSGPMTADVPISR